MTELEKDFAVNYYQWAKHEYQREIEEGFPLLSRLRCTFSLRTYEFMVALPEDQQHVFALARTKHSNPEAAELCGERITAAEQELLASYRQRSAIEYPVVGVIRYGGPCKSERDIIEAIDRKELSAQHSNKVFRAAVLARVTEALGRVEIDQFETIKHVAGGDDWRITTSISLKGKFPLRYTQYLTGRRNLSLETSFLRWMGIMGDTYWDLITTDVTEEAIGQLVSLCKKFISEGPLLLPN